MSNAPHVHTVEEAKANIGKIEHNSSGEGPGPGGKRGGAPTGIEGGSGTVEKSGGGVVPTSKGADWISHRGE